ncbi:hypothetical protein [Herbaspirillum autotrophicum]|uniref:hypothetical protein n=1 Tax=Herbaspirillum autotrophicum TaxID=180195 RepID=UPI000A428FA7|nr:hypothetical protein [Herbaspirillum autotrophicum]
MTAAGGLKNRFILTTFLRSGKKTAAPYRTGKRWRAVVSRQFVAANEKALP